MLQVAWQRHCKWEWCALWCYTEYSKLSLSASQKEKQAQESWWASMECNDKWWTGDFFPMWELQCTEELSIKRHNLKAIVFAVGVNADLCSAVWFLKLNLVLWIHRRQFNAYSNFHPKFLRTSKARTMIFEHAFFCQFFIFSVSHLELVILQNDLPFFGS